MATLSKCVAEPAVICQAHRTPHACHTRTLRMPAKTPLAEDNIHAPAACTVPFRPYCGVRGCCNAKRNVSKYMLVLAICLVKIPVVKTELQTYTTPSLWNVSNEESSFWSTLDRSGSTSPSLVTRPFSCLSKTRRTIDGNGSNSTLLPSCFIWRSAFTHQVLPANQLLTHNRIFSSLIIRCFKIYFLKYTICQWHMTPRNITGSCFYPALIFYNYC